MLTPDEIEDYAWRLTGGAEAVLESAVLEVLISEFVLVCGLDPGTVAALNAIVAGRANVRQAVSALIARYNPVVKSEAASLTFELLERGDAREATRLAAEYGKAPSDLSEVAAQAAAGIQQIVARDNVMMGQVAEDAWWDACTMVTTGSMSGEKSLDELIAEGVDYLTRRGVSTVTYVDDEGNVTRRDSVDVAVRRHAMTQANQAGGRMTMQRMVEFGHDLVQTTAHLGARPTHEPWQGRAFSLTGPREVDGTVYPNFYEETGYGTVGGLQGANCRHTFYSYFPGDELPERPDPEENAERYKAEQKQRRIEREIRKCKQGIAGDQLALESLDGDPERTRTLEEQLARKQVRLKNLQATMREHIATHDYLVRQPKREKDYLKGRTPNIMRGKGKERRPRTPWENKAVEALSSSEDVSAYLMAKHGIKAHVDTGEDNPMVLDAFGSWDEKASEELVEKNRTAFSHLPLEDQKAVVAGIEYAYSRYGKGCISIINAYPMGRDDGVYNAGERRVGIDLKCDDFYLTGIHEAIHSIDAQKSMNMKGFGKADEYSRYNLYSRSVLDSAKRKLGWKVNTHDYKDEVIRLFGMKVSRARGHYDDHAEIVALAIEFEAQGRGTEFTKAIAMEFGGRGD